jgi:hypothetical protein
MRETTATAISEPAERVAWYVIPVAIALASRVYSVLLLLVLQGDTHLLPMLVDDPSPLVAWDGQWYLHIAASGYHAEPVQGGGPIGHYDFAFFPGWPLLIRLVSLGGLLPMGGTAVALSNVLFVFAAVAAYRLFAERFDRRVAIGGLLLLAFNPAAYVFSMAYSESLFVLLLALFFLNDKRWPGPIFAGLAMLTRVAGLALGASQAVMLVIRREARPIRLLSCLAVALVFAGWWIYIWLLTGNFTGWLLGPASWSRLMGPISLLRELDNLRGLLWASFVALMFVGSALLLRKQTDMAVYGMLAIAVSFLGGSGPSMPRHSMIAIPAFAAIALRLGPRATTLTTIGFAIAQVLFVNFAFGPKHRAP